MENTTTAVNLTYTERFNMSANSSDDIEEWMYMYIDTGEMELTSKVSRCNGKVGSNPLPQNVDF